MRLGISALCLLLAAPPVGATTSEPLATEDLLRRATVALEAGEAGAAADLYEKLRASEPDNPAGWVGGGLAAEAGGDLETAVLLLGRAAELDPDRAAVHLAHGRVLARTGAAGPALAAFARAREFDPTQADAYLFAALLERDAGRLKEAETLLREAIERAAPRPEFWDQLGLVLLSRRQPDAALAAVEDSVARFGSTPRIELVRGLALAQDPDRRAEAIASLELAIGGGEGGAPARVELAELYLAGERVEDAVRVSTEAVEMAPSDPGAHFRLGQALQLAGRREEAATALQRFQKLRSERDAAGARAKRLGSRLNTAIEHLEASRLEEALAVVDEVLADAPGNARTLAMKAKILFSMGDVPGALEAAIAARKAGPAMTEHHYLEGLFSYHAGKLEAASTALERALAIDPELGQAHEAAAVVALRRERPDEAVRHFERAIALGVDHDELRKAYALALEAARR